MTLDAPRDSSNGDRELSYREWGERLCNRFFRPEYDGLPVMFFVDDEALASLYGGDSEAAVKSLLQALRGRLSASRPRQLFARIESEGRRWKVGGAEGVPPFLPLLAVAVLAATRMGRRRDRAAHNYYTPLRELLGLDIAIDDLKSSSGDALPYLWQTLQWWLDDKHRGKFGFSTITGGYFYYSYAGSQTLFSSSDRDKLTQFFRWIRLKPGERVDEVELMTYFRIWASRREDLSEGAAFMLEDEEQSAQLAAIVKAAADRWRGTVREDGVLGGDILLTLELFPRPRLGLVAEQPAQAPAELACRGPRGREITLTSSHEGWYDELEVAVDKPLLDGGLQLQAQGLRLRLPPYNVHVLGKNVDLGKWASSPQLSPGEPAWLIVRQPALQAVSDYLERAAHSDWRVVEREGLAPDGWRLVGEVIVDAASTDQAPDSLARIVPRVQNRFTLKGGLPLPRGSATYLLGGEPDLWLPPPADDMPYQLELDEKRIDLRSSSTHVRLADQDLPDGPHTARMQGISRSFASVRTLGNATPHPSRTIGHRINRVADIAEAASAGAQGLDTDGSTELRILGAIIEDPEHDQSERPPAPLILPRRAIRRTLLGASPGEIETPSPPAESPWMRRTKLHTQVFEFTPSFPVAWIVTERQLAPTQQVRLIQPMEPAHTSAAGQGRDVHSWAQAIKRAPVPREEDAAGLWASYLRRAAEVDSA